jgi:hypothetical protein
MAEVTDGTPIATRLALLATLVVTAVALAEFVRRSPDRTIGADLAAPFLWLFSALFVVRVGGQLLVRLRRPAWLPPTKEWNLSPYRLLLPAQIGILGLMTWIDVSFSTGSGPPVDPRPDLGRGVLVFSFVYAGVMIARYLVRMARRPEERWFGGAVPIVFHLVLASYLFVIGSFHASY